MDLGGEFHGFSFLVLIEGTNPSILKGNKTTFWQCAKALASHATQKHTQKTSCIHNTSSNAGKITQTVIGKPTTEATPGTLWMEVQLLESSTKPRNFLS